MISTLIRYIPKSPNTINFNSYMNMPYSTLGELMGCQTLINNSGVFQLPEDLNL